MNRINIMRFPPLGNAGEEAINTLCTNISFAGTNIKRIVITSCRAGDGKSFMAMNIMRTLAKLGKSVILVDGDLRRSVLASRYSFQFDQDYKHGLAHYLAGMDTEKDIIYSTNIPGAYIVPIGREVSNSLALLASPLLSQLMDRLAGMADYVIVDAPPLGAIIDAVEIAKSCDGSIIVVSYDNVRRQELIKVKEQLEKAEKPILGAVMNKVRMDGRIKDKYYYNMYYNGYSYDDDASRHGKKTRLSSDDGK